jgi:hypothetical protein
MLCARPGRVALAAEPQGTLCCQKAVKPTAVAVLWPSICTLPKALLLLLLLLLELLQPMGLPYRGHLQARLTMGQTTRLTTLRAAVCRCLPRDTALAIGRSTTQDPKGWCRHHAPANNRPTIVKLIDPSLTPSRPLLMSPDV